jgi:hypothetical protein
MTAVKLEDARRVISAAEKKAIEIGSLLCPRRADGGSGLRCWPSPYSLYHSPRTPGAGFRGRAY